MVVLVFVDGVGVGTRGSHNPLDGADSPFFGIFDGEPSTPPLDGRLALTDACLGVAGLPQSATGQTTIITGENAPRFLGRHLSAFPGGSLRPILRERSLFRRLAERGLRVAHANVAPSSIAGRRVRTLSATAIAAEEAGLPLRTLDDVRAGRALHHEFTNEALIAHGIELSRVSPQRAARILADIARDHDFTAFEYFSTDAAGHACDADEVRRHIGALDVFLRSLLESVDLSSSTVVLTSDHGNVEDLSTGGHTLNSVATIAWGDGSTAVASSVRSLVDIAPAIERYLVSPQN